MLTLECVHDGHSVYYYFFEQSRDVILRSKRRLAAQAAQTEGDMIAAGGALSTLESMMAGAIAGEPLLF